MKNDIGIDTGGVENILGTRGLLRDRRKLTCLPPLLPTCVFIVR